VSVGKPRTRSGDEPGHREGPQLTVGAGEQRNVLETYGRYQSDSALLRSEESKPGRQWRARCIERVHGGFGEGDGETRLSEGRKVRPVPTLRSGGEGGDSLAAHNLGGGNMMIT
jgi:hypothetical protein